jgi:hypothetical protein
MRLNDFRELAALLRNFVTPEPPPPGLRDLPTFREAAQSVDPARMGGRAVSLRAPTGAEKPPRKETLISPCEMKRFAGMV